MKHKWIKSEDTRYAHWQCKKCGCEKFRSSKPVRMALVGGTIITMYKPFMAYLIDVEVYDKAPECKSIQEFPR